MVVYEVNLEINKDIFNDYYSWLLEHVKEILKIEGFKSAEIGFIDHEVEMKKIRINYSINSYDNLKIYINEHAPKLRAEAQRKFGDQFHISRRIIKDRIFLEADK